MKIFKLEYFLSDFKKKKYLNHKIKLFFVVKSQDQLVRRDRMIKSLNQNKIFGRIKKRETADGFFGHLTVDNGKVNIDLRISFKEPRHLVEFDKDNFLITEINKVHKIEKKSGKIIDSFNSEWFSFLHTIELNKEKDKFLVASSGFDSVIEMSLKTKKILYHWCGWEQGFNPDEEGTYLSKDLNTYKKYLNENKKTILIEPKNFGEQGILTAMRTAHPNLAVYKSKNEFIVGIGRSGKLYSHSKNTNSTSILFDKLSQMSHGLRKYKNNWIVTDTTAGKVNILSKDFKITDNVYFKRLEGKPDILGEIEWVQNTIQLNSNEFISIDSNRGLIHFNLKEKIYAIYQLNENWCFQDIYFNAKQ